jgi:hypothetical protein
MKPFEEMRDRLRSYKVDDSLVFLNYVLQASKNPVLNPSIYEISRTTAGLVTNYKIEFFAKWLILSSEFTSSIIVSPKQLDWAEYYRLSQLYNQINDPYVEEHGGRDANAVNLFLRMLYQQLPGQQRISLQSFGSSYLLFNTVCTKAEDGVSYNTAEVFENLTDLPVEKFMQIGLLLSSARAGPYKTPGTLNSEWIKSGQELSLPNLEQGIVQRALSMLSCTIDSFKENTARSHPKVFNDRYVLYEFNPLYKYPFINIGQGRYVAPNPSLIVDRVTFGVYYDLLDFYGKSFTDNFGFIFQKYIGVLLKSIYPGSKIFPESPYGPRKYRKAGPADWAIIDGNSLLLLECKALVPNLKFTSLASDEDLHEYTSRIADAVEQTYKHIAAIQAGEPSLKVFSGLSPIIAIITLGRLQLINTLILKPIVYDELSKRGVTNPSYVVLSLQELENLLSLVERGASLYDLLHKIEESGWMHGLQAYNSMLRQNALPSLVEKAGNKIIATA